SFGNSVSGVTVTFTAPATATGVASGTFANTTRTTTVVTTAGGVATASVFTANHNAGAYTVVANASGASSANFSLTNTAGSATTFSVAGFTSPTTAGAAHAFSVAALDTFENTATGYRGTTHFTSTDTQAALPADYTFLSSDNGTRSAFSATLKTAGTQAITASDGTISGTQTAITVTAGSVASVTVSSGSGQSATVNTGFTNPLVALAKDTFNNPVSGATVTFTAPGSGASGTFAGGVATATTNANGLATSAAFTANTTAGAYNVSAAAGSGSVHFALTNTAGTANKFAFTTSVVSGAASSNANLGPITVQAQDIFGNPVTAGAGGITVNLASTSSGKLFATTLNGTTGVTSVSIVQNNSSVSLFYGDTKAGTPTITASGSLPSATQVETITAGSPTRIGLTSSTGALTSCVLGCTKSGLGNNANGTSKVSITDSFGNTVSNLGTLVTVTITKVGGTVTPGTLDIPATGLAESSASLSWSEGTGSYNDSVTVAKTGYTSVVANLSH